MPSGFPNNNFLNVYIQIFLTARFSQNYRGGTFYFSFTVSPIYPHEAPKVKCKTKVNLSGFLPTAFDPFSIESLREYSLYSDYLYFMQVYHPNIDLEGNVCLNILREDWKPVLNINTVIYGLYHLFTV